MTIKPCENYSLCQNMIPNINFQSDYCMQCGDWFKLGFGWNKLEFSGEEKECKSCKKSTKQLKFPTECGHWVCVDCSLEIVCSGTKEDIILIPLHLEVHHVLIIVIIP